MSQLEELLQQCTVKLTIPGRMGWGTGFFVAPGWILTCAHVVQEAKGQPIQVRWQSQENWAQAVVQRPSPIPHDLALLRVTLPIDTEPPCVYLDEEIQSRDPLYLFGYPDQDFPNGCPATFSCEGLTGDDPVLIKFALGQVRPGMSGSPLLNQRTGKVCGIVKFTRDRTIDLGGGATPTSAIFQNFPDLQQQNSQFHQQDTRWKFFLVPPSPTVQLTRKDYRNRQAVLDKVHNNWIKGVLEQAFYNRAKIEIGLEERLDLINLLGEVPDRPRRQFLQGENAITKFDELGTGRTLLILGDPGSGKTILLLEIAKELIERANRDVSLPIPVVFNLSSWSNRKHRFIEWLIQELNVKFQIPEVQGNAWIKEQQLLLLLDGLDEIRQELRDYCVQEINQFSQRYGLTEIIVCSRIAMYEALTQKLNFQAAIFAQPLTQEQISTYLNQTESDSLGVKTALQTDPVLQELVRSPLMLSIVVSAYQGMTVSELSPISEEQHQQVFEQYINRALRLRHNNSHYDKDLSIQWLSFLAQQMIQENQTVFLIEQIQPTWLTSRIFRWVYPICVASTAGLFAEFLFGSLIGLMGDWFSLQMLLGLLSGLVFGTISSVNQKIQLLETIGWYWSFSRAWHAAVPALIGGPLIGIIISSGKFINIPVQSWQFNLAVGLIGGSIAGILLALVSATLVGLTSSEIEIQTFPNQGLWRSVQRSFISTFICLIIFVLPFLLLAQSFIPLATVLGIVTVLLSFTSFYTGGLAAIQHLITRIMLWSMNKIPWNYSDFLNYATDRMLIQRVGGGYQFAHNLLRKQLASKTQDEFRKFLKPAKFWKKYGIAYFCLVSLLIIGIFVPSSIDVLHVDKAIANILKSSGVQENERILVDKIFYRCVGLKRGDVVLFNIPESWKRPGFNQIQDITRIIGIPGDTVEIKTGRIYINAQLLQQENLALPPNLNSYGPENIPEASYFVIVNNPNYNDNRQPFISKTHIAGRCICPGVALK
jgi:signal peptidase I